MRFLIALIWFVALVQPASASEPFDPVAVHGDDPAQCDRIGIVVMPPHSESSRQSAYTLHAFQDDVPDYRARACGKTTIIAAYCSTTHGRNDVICWVELVARYGGALTLLSNAFTLELSLAATRPGIIESVQFDTVPIVAPGNPAPPTPVPGSHIVTVRFKDVDTEQASSYPMRIVYLDSGYPREQFSLLIVPDPFTEE